MAISVYEIEADVDVEMAGALAARSLWPFSPNHLQSCRVPGSFGSSTPNACCSRGMGARSPVIQIQGVLCVSCVVAGSAQGWRAEGRRETHTHTCARTCVRAHCVRTHTPVLPSGLWPLAGHLWFSPRSVPRPLPTWLPSPVGRVCPVQSPSRQAPLQAIYACTDASCLLSSLSSSKQVLF